VSEYDRRTKTATELATIGSGARSIATWDQYVVFGFERGEVLLGTRTGVLGSGTKGTLETVRLTARPVGR
jgi:hypothetical protein